jgi:hypothetical protein
LPLDKSFILWHDLIMGKFIDHTGTIFGRLTALKYLRRDGRGNAVWLCRCECKKEVEVFANNLRRGLTTSCGCFRKETILKIHTTHGHSINGKLTPEFKAYRAMIQRCTNKNKDTYKYYGERGITVCPRWLESFQNFFNDMGLKPTPQHTIDRKDVNGNYEPSNCKWATKKEQADNRRSHPQVVADHIKTRAFSGCDCVICATVRQIAAPIQKAAGENTAFSTSAGL